MIETEPVFDEDTVDNLNVEITKVNTLCEKINADIVEVNIPPGMLSIINDLCEAICMVTNVQSAIVKQLNRKKVSRPQTASLNTMVSLGAIPKRVRQEYGPQLLPPPPVDNEGWIPATSGRQNRYARRQSVVSAVSAVSIDPPKDPKIEKFRDAVKEAEKSTLAFNLDMGTVPIMNRDSIAQKATLALTKMAAQVEKPGTSIPSEDVVAAIDDALSVTTGYEIYGTATKTYRHPTDKLSGAYCTVPVRYDFESKDARVRAEKIFRDKCNVNCAVPYPTMVRESIKQVINNVRREHPNNLVRVTIDTGKCCFNISRRPVSNDSPPGAAPDTGNGTSTGLGEAASTKKPRPWIVYGSKVIPEAAFDVDTKRVPTDFKINWPLPDCKKPPSNEEEGDMEVSLSPDAL
jgi:hypothetical protein